MKWTLINQAGTNDPDTGDIYSGLDRFGRVKDNRWIDGEGTDLDRIQYGYDRSGNRIWRRNTVAAALDKEFDELYAYDGVHRLQDMARGALNAERTALTSETFAQCWTLDSTGNWQGFREDSDGNGAWDFIQQRTANPVNEITDISETTGPSWIIPAYSRAGNMTTMPKVADPTVSQACQYDAWNRLTKVSEGDNTVAEYQYDGAKRRVVQKSYTAGVLSETRHLYYTEPSKWQVIEERVGTSPDSADAERQFVWGLRYIDDLVLRDRDTDANGSLNERLYACQDANWNVTSVTDVTAAVQERYAYTAYGMPLVLTSAFGSRSTSLFGWETLYCGYRFDFATTLFHVRNRVYATSAGIWIQRDPLGYADSWNLYGYCHSSPIQQIDSLGLLGADEFVRGMIDFVKTLSLRGGARECFRACSRVWAPSGCVCIVACFETDVRHCCVPVIEPCCIERRKLCNLSRLDVEIGLYECTSLGGTGFMIPPWPAFQTAWMPALKRIGGGVFGISGTGCPAEGVSGSVCVTASAGFSTWTVGARGCYDFRSGNFTVDAGYGVGVGTGVSGGGSITLTTCMLGGDCCR
jgi:RHS repeat-associated protein